LLNHLKYIIIGSQLSQEETFDPSSTSTVPLQPIERVIIQPKKKVKVMKIGLFDNNSSFLPLVIAKETSSILTSEFLDNSFKAPSVHSSIKITTKSKAVNIPSSSPFSNEMITSQGKVHILTVDYIY